MVVGYYTIFTRSSGAKIERLTGQPCLLSVNNSPDSVLHSAARRVEKLEPLLKIKRGLNISEWVQIKPQPISNAASRFPMPKSRICQLKLGRYFLKIFKAITNSSVQNISGHEYFSWWRAVNVTEMVHPFFASLVPCYPAINEASSTFACVIKSKGWE